jgi:hypothetical protein
LFTFALECTYTIRKARENQKFLAVHRTRQLSFCANELKFSNESLNVSKNIKEIIWNYNKTTSMKAVRVEAKVKM